MRKTASLTHVDVGEPTLGTSASVGALQHQSSHLNLSSAASSGTVSPLASRAASARVSVPWTRRPSVFFALCVLATTVLALLTHEGRSTTCERAPEYVVFVDAGSTGCRAHAFRVTPTTKRDEGNDSLFRIETLGTKTKTKMPLAQMGGRVREELLPAVRSALERVPDAAARERASVYVWATAGFRVLTPAKQQALWREVREVMTRETTLRHGHGHFRTVDGSEEGFYAWLAANYLSNVDVTAVGRMRRGAAGAAPFARLADSENPLARSVGAIDVGGGSVQYVALPKGGGAAVTPKSMMELRDSVKVESFLGYGANHMETRWRETLANDGHTENACAFPGYVVEVRGARLTGTGSYDECVRGLRRQIVTLEREQGVTLRMPREFDRIDRFLGMSLLFHLTNFMTVAVPGSLPSMPRATLDEIAVAGKTLCAIEWSKISKSMDGKDPNTPSDRLNGRCFDAALVQALLGRGGGGDGDSDVGLGFDQKDVRIDFVERIDGAEVEWTLGAALSVVHPTLARANPGWVKTRVPLECRRVVHASLLNALYRWAVIIMPAGISVTAYLVYSVVKATAKVGTMARSPSFLEVL